MTYLSNQLLAARVHSATGELNAFRGHSYLVVVVGARILHLDLVLLFEILLKSVQEDVVVLLRDARVANQKARRLFQDTGQLRQKRKVNIGNSDRREP